MQMVIGWLVVKINTYVTRFDLKFLFKACQSFFPIFERVEIFHSLTKNTDPQPDIRK